MDPLLFGCLLLRFWQKTSSFYGQTGSYVDKLTSVLLHLIQDKKLDIAYPLVSDTLRPPF